MTAPDFRTQVIEVVSYGKTNSFIVKDITGVYDSQENPGGWDPDLGAGPNLAPEDIRYAMMMITPYKGKDIPVLLEMTNTLSALYWRKLLTHLSEEGIILDLSVLGLEDFVDGYWQFKNYYWPGYYTAAFAVPAVGVFQLGEIVQGGTSGATGFIVKSDASPYHIAWIQGTFINGEVITGLDSGAFVTVTTFAVVGEILTNEVYSYTNEQSVLTATRNKIRKQPLDIILPRINEKHALNVSIADMMLETLDDAVEVGQIENYIVIFDYLQEFIERIDETYCID